MAVVGRVVDLDAADADRLPQAETCRTALAGISLPRLPVAAAVDPLPGVLAWVRTAEA